MELIDGRKLGAIIRRVRNAKTEIPKIENKVDSKYAKKVGQNLDLIARSAIDAFYEGYTPLVYNRLEDLYHTYKITAEKKDWRIELGPEFMHGGHHRENDYIYWMAFVNGYHGGAPHNGDMYWRQPVPYYTEWYPTPAPQSVSPHDKIVAESNAYLDEMKQQAQSEFDNSVNKILDEVIDMIDSL